MKALISVITLVLVSVSASFAQNPERMDYPPERNVKYTPEQIAQKRTDDLSRKITLTEQQRNQVYNLFLDQSRQMEQQREQVREARIRQQEALNLQRNRCESEMKTILTPDQYTQWMQLRSDRCPDCDDNGHPRHHRDMGPGRNRR